MRFVVAALAIVFLFARPARAVGSVGAGTVVSIETGLSGEGVAITLSGGGVPGCGAATEFSLSADQKNYKDLLALLTTAFLSGHTITVIGTAGTCSAPGKRTQILAIRIQ